MSETTKPWSMTRVVTASSAGTAFEWYDFFIFGSLTPVIAKVFFAGLEPTGGAGRRAGAVRGRLRLPAAGRDHLRRDGRPRRAQGDLPGHRQPDGRRDLRHRPAADLRAGRDPRADPADLPAHLPGHRARRRIWRRGDLRRRACRQRQARRGDRLDPVLGLVRPARGAAGDLRHPHRPRRRGVRRLGLAHPVPRSRPCCSPSRCGCGSSSARARTSPS